MLIILLILVVLTVVLWVVVVQNDSEDAVFGAVGLTSLSVIAAFMCVRFDFNSQNLSGYIYSSSDAFGYTTAHIRFSENAGKDEQPSFCVETNSEAGKAIQKYSGSGKKVDVKIPAYFYITNNLFECGTSAMTIQEAKS